MSARAVRRWIIVLVLLQVTVLVLLPLRAGPRMPSGTTVVLRADAGDSPVADFADMPSGELWLDYGFDELDELQDARPGAPVYVVLDGDPGSDRPMTPTVVLEDEGKLRDGMTWLSLRLLGDGDIDPGPLLVWNDDPDSIAMLRAHAERGGSFDVRVRLDNDGDPTLESVAAVRSS